MKFSKITQLFSAIFAGLTLWQVPAPAQPPPQPLTQPLSREERQLVVRIDPLVDESIALLRRVVDIPSTTLNLAGVKKVGDVFAREFRSLGFTVRWIDMPDSLHRAGHLIAERTGSRGKRILLLGHFDTVLEGGPFERDGMIARGPGVADMKGGNVIMLLVLKALQSIDALDNTRMIVMLTGDEENAGKPHEVSRRDMKEAGQRSDLALSFEGLLKGTVVTGRRGVSSWRLEVSGRTGHSGGIFGDSLGSGAIFEAARILRSWHEKLGGEKYLTYNPSTIVGGTDVSFDPLEERGTAAGKTNVVAQKTLVEGDLRFISEEQKERARSRMREIVGHHLPLTSAKITFADGYPSMSPSPGSDSLAREYDAISRELGLGAIRPGDPGARGAGDISFVTPQIPGLDGLGIEGGMDHAPGEYADLTSIAVQARRVAVLIYRLTR